MPSTAIRSFTYDASRNELCVMFTTGRGYVYSLVPPGVFAAFSAARSKGAFLNEHIRNRYPFRQTSATVSSLRENLVASGGDEEPDPVLPPVPRRR